jgi:hypothetical protein
MPFSGPCPNVGRPKISQKQVRAATFQNRSLQAKKLSNEGHGFSRAVNRLRLTALAAGVRFSEATGGRVISFRTATNDGERRISGAKAY